jgi:hypothetical protein
MSEWTPCHGINDNKCPERIRINEECSKMALNTDQKDIAKALSIVEKGKYNRLSELCKVRTDIGRHFEEVLYRESIREIGEIFIKAAIEEKRDEIIQAALAELKVHIDAECQKQEQLISEARNEKA